MVNVPLQVSRIQDNILILIDGLETSDISLTGKEKQQVFTLEMLKAANVWHLNLKNTLQGLFCC